MDNPVTTFEQIEELSADPAAANIAALRSALGQLQQVRPPADDPPRCERWQRAHDIISAALNQKLIHRRLVAAITFGGATVLLVVADLLFR